MEPTRGGGGRAGIAPINSQCPFHPWCYVRWWWKEGEEEEEEEEREEEEKKA